MVDFMFKESDGKFIGFPTQLLSVQLDSPVVVL